MQTIHKYLPFFVSAVLMCGLLCLIFPHYQYYVDPDDTAYLTISQRYAAGDYQTAINGYWSPWACWFTAMLIREGLAAIPAGVIVNAAGGLGFLFIALSFFLYFGLARRLQWLLCGTLALFLCYAVFWQSFDDLWECFFLLCTLRLLLAKSFGRSPGLWVLCGVLGAFAYFAKAYSFPFFIVNTFCCSWLVVTDNKRWRVVVFVTTATMLLCSLPWIIALHHKYGMWTTSTAGTLNISWYLVGHPHWKEGIGLLLPPPYAGSPYYWEDPYFANGATPHFWNSLSLFGFQIVRIGANVLKMLASMLQLSVFLPIIFIDFILLFKPLFARSKKSSAGPPVEVFLMGVSFLLFLSGYMLVNFESRYIWYLIVPGMVLEGLIIQGIKKSSFQNILLAIFALSFLIYPAMGMKKMYGEGANEYQAAAQLKQMNIHGSFTANVKPGTEAQRTERLAYFSGNQFYSLAKPIGTQQELLQEMRRYHVNYYFAYGEQAGINNFTDEQGKPFPEITNGRIKGLKVFAVNP